MHPEFTTPDDSARRLPAKIIIFVLAAFTCTFLTACKKGPDASTPKKAAALFAKAAQEGDTATLHQVATGTDAEFELCKGLGQVMTAFDKFATAASNKFGTDAGHVNEMSINPSTDSDEAEEKIDGDTALLIPKPHGNDEPGEPYKLKKVGSGWKMDLSFLDRDARAKQISEKLPAVALVWDQATAEVEAGKFAIFSEAKAAVKSRVDLATSDPATARQKVAGYDMASLLTALDEYKKDAAEFPSTADGLLALTEKPVTATNWHGPYLKKTITSDPWGHPYIYVNPGRHNTNYYDLHSMGPDGMDDTADDIVNWDVQAGK